MKKPVFKWLNIGADNIGLIYVSTILRGHKTQKRYK